MYYIIASLKNKTVSTNKQCARNLSSNINNGLGQRTDVRHTVWEAVLWRHIDGSQNVLRISCGKFQNDFDTIFMMLSLQTYLDENRYNSWIRFENGLTGELDTFSYRITHLQI